MNDNTDEYMKKLDRSLAVPDVTNVLRTMDKLASIPACISSATIRLCTSTDQFLVEIWWDSESETWLADFGSES